MSVDKIFLVQFPFLNMRIIRNSFNEVCNGFHVPDFEKKIGMKLDSVSDYMENIELIYRLTFNLHYKGEEVLPETQKQLTDGHIAYWDAKSQSVIFEAPNKTRIVYQPEEGRSYFTKLATMDFPVESEYELSLLMRVGVSELKLMLAVVRQTYEYLHKEIGGGEYRIRMGQHPAEAEKTIKELQQEIDKHTV